MMTKSKSFVDKLVSDFWNTLSTYDREILFRRVYGFGDWGVVANIPYEVLPNTMKEKLVEIYNER